MLDYAELRALLSVTPSRRGFERIWRLLRKAPAEEQEAAVEYAQSHLEPWPWQMRVFHASWYQDFHLKDAPRAHLDLKAWATREAEDFFFPPYFRLARWFRLLGEISMGISDIHMLNGGLLLFLKGRSFLSHMTHIDLSKSRVEWLLRWRQDEPQPQLFEQVLVQMPSQIRSINAMGVPLSQAHGGDPTKTSLEVMLEDRQERPLQLEALDLRRTRLSDAQLAGLLAMTHPLRALNLGLNPDITEDGAALLAQWPGLAKLEYLSLHGCTIGGPGRRRIENSPHFPLHWAQGSSLPTWGEPGPDLRYN